MDYIVSVLRRDTFLRVFTWIQLSLMGGAFGLISVLSLCVLIMPFTEAEAYLTRAFVMLAAQLISLLIPAKILPKLSKDYKKTPKAHFLLSIVTWLFMIDTGFFILTFALIHLAIWAEVVGVYWRTKLA